MGPRGKKRGRGGKVLLLVVLVAGVGIGGYQLLKPEGGSSGGGPPPEQVARDFVTALNDRDCDRILDLATEASWATAWGGGGEELSREDAVTGCQEELAADEGITGETTIEEMTELSNDGEVAEVEATVSFQEGPEGEPTTETTTLTLRMEGGSWKVDMASFLGEESVDAEAPSPDDATTSPDAPATSEDVPVTEPADDASTAPATSDDPTEVVVRFYGALKVEDCEGMADVAEDHLFSESGGFGEENPDPVADCQAQIASGELRTDYSYIEDPSGFEVGENGDQVTVDVDRTLTGEDESWDYFILREDNGLKISSFSQ